MEAFSPRMRTKTSGGQSLVFQAVLPSLEEPGLVRILGTPPLTQAPRTCETAYIYGGSPWSQKGLVLFPLEIPFLDPRRRLEKHRTLLDSRGPCFLSGKIVPIKAWRNIGQYLVGTSLYQPLCPSYHIFYLILISTAILGSRLISAILQNRKLGLTEV